jgi:hypothetical protein
MNIGSAIFATVFMLAAIELRAQDLFERKKKDSDSTALEVRSGQEGLHARIAPDFDYQALDKDRGSSRTGGGVDFDYDFACGRFDLRSSLKNLLSREFRDEFVTDLLNAGEGYLASSALNLLCQSSPTLCNVFKHHRASANLLLGLGYDKCRAMEQVLQNDAQRTRARILKDCMERKLRENPNVPIDEAYEACLKSDEIRNFRGEFVKEINLVEDLSKYFQIEGQRKGDLEQIFGKARVSSKGVTDQASLVDAVGSMYTSTKRAYLDAWGQALRDVAAGRESAHGLYEQLSPEGVRLGPDDVRQINLLPDWKRDLLIRALASLFAYYETIRRIAAVESLLSELEASGKSGALKDKLAKDRERLREERERMKSEFEAARQVQQAIVAGRDEVEAHVATILQNKVGALQQQIETERIQKDFGTPWGEFKSRAENRPAPISGASKAKAAESCCSGQGNFNGGVYKK